MNETIKTILNRRSCRAYKDEQISNEELSFILDCGLSAPSAMNSQDWHFTVIQNKDLIDEMNMQIKKILPQPAKERMLSRNNGNENYSMFYFAPTVIIISGFNDDNYSQINCSLATQNMCLAAESLDIGSCVIGFAAMLFHSPKREEYIKKLNIPDNYKPLYAVCFGYKDMEMMKPERISGKVNFIR